jgi:hypothetical protein
VIVIDVLGLARGAQGTDSALLKDHPGNLNAVDPIPPVQVEGTAAPMVLLSVLRDYGVVTRLAIASISALGRPVPSEISKRLGFAATGATPSHRRVP